MVQRFSYKVKLIPISQRAQKVIAQYSNELFLIEYDRMGRPLNRAPNGKQGIFCRSSDGDWNGWFVLDEDVRFTPETESLLEYLKQI